MNFFAADHHHMSFSHTLRPVIRRMLSVGFCGAVMLAMPAAHAQTSPLVNCESLLTSFKFPNTTITGATLQPGGPYCGTDTWHVCFSNLPPSCQVTAEMTPTSDSDELFAKVGDGMKG